MAQRTGQLSGKYHRVARTRLQPLGQFKGESIGFGIEAQGTLAQALSFPLAVDPDRLLTEQSHVDGRRKNGPNVSVSSLDQALGRDFQKLGNNRLETPAKVPLALHPQRASERPGNDHFIRRARAEAALCLEAEFETLLIELRPSAQVDRLPLAQNLDSLGIVQLAFEQPRVESGYQHRFASCYHRVAGCG